MAKSYYQKLLDPRWQRVKSEIMQRDNFCCQHCRSVDNTINVHHKKYFYDKEPWEYDYKYLMCLCLECHKKEEKHKKEFVKSTEEILLLGGDYSDLNNVLQELLQFYKDLNNIFKTESLNGK